MPAHLYGLPVCDVAKANAFSATWSVVVPGIEGSLAASASTWVRIFACAIAFADGGAVGVGAVGVGAGAGVTATTFTVPDAETQAGVPVRPRAAHVAASTTPVRGSFSRCCAASTAARVCGPNAPATVTRKAFCKTPTDGPTAPICNVVQLVVTPVPDTGWPQAAAPTATGNAFQVATSTAPVCLSPCAFCQVDTAFAVIGPKSPSGVALTARCRVTTAGPCAPVVIVAQSAVGGSLLVAPAAANDVRPSTATRASATWFARRRTRLQSKLGNSNEALQERAIRRVRECSDCCCLGCLE